MQSLAILALSAIAAAAPTPESKAGSFSIPFKRAPHHQRADGSVNSDWFFAELNKTLVKYHAKPLDPIAALLSKRAGGSGAVPLTDQIEEGQGDVLYYGNGQVSGQTFTFDFDTGSSDTFVPGPQCGTAQGCSGSTKYDQSGTDRKNTTTIAYGSGNVEGENYLDDVTVGGLTATGQNVISLTTSAGFETSNANSLMGFGFEEIAESKSPPFFKTLLNQGKVTAPEFSFYLGRAASGTGQNSELFLGGRNSAKYTGTVYSVPVTQKGYWQVAVDGVQVNGGKGLLSILPGLLTPGQAAIDTGTTLIIAPTLATTTIFANVPGAIPIPLAAGGLTPLIFAYPCNNAPNISFVFNSHPFAVNPLDLSLGTIDLGLGQLLGSLLGNNTLTDILSGGSGGSGGGYCLASIAGEDFIPGENFYIVGDSFLKNWYSIYSYGDVQGTKPTVNFAKAV